jgi:hypothetical protein
MILHGLPATPCLQSKMLPYYCKSPRGRYLHDIYLPQPKELLWNIDKLIHVIGHYFPALLTVESNFLVDMRGATVSVFWLIVSQAWFLIKASSKILYLNAHQRVQFSSQI